MAESQRTIKELDCSNIAIEWPMWKQNLMVYMTANGKTIKSERTKIAIFLWLIGSRGVNIYNTLFPNDGSHDSLLGTTIIERLIPAIVARDGQEAQHERVEKEIRQRTFDDVLKKFDEHCLPQKNVAMESFKFNTIVQKKAQSFSEFETELRTQLRKCDFKCVCGALYEERILRDRIIVGVDKKLQLKLLDGRDRPLTSVIALCKIYDAAKISSIISKALSDSLSLDSQSADEEYDSSEFGCSILDRQFPQYDTRSHYTGSDNSLDENYHDKIPEMAVTRSPPPLTQHAEQTYKCNVL